MANTLYAKGRENFGKGAIDWVNDDIRVILVDLADYTPNLATDNALDDIPAAARVAVKSSSLAGKTMVDGVADANDFSFTGIAGDETEALVIYLHTGTEGTSFLIAFLDGKMYVTMAADAAGGATSLFCEALVDAMASGATLSKISGTGPATITSSAGAAAGSRSLSVTAIGSNIVAGAIYEVAVDGSGFPVPVNPGTVNITFGSGANKIFKL